MVKRQRVALDVSDSTLESELYTALHEDDIWALSAFLDRGAANDMRHGVSILVLAVYLQKPLAITLLLLYNAKLQWTDETMFWNMWHSSTDPQKTLLHHQQIAYQAYLCDDCQVHAQKHLPPDLFLIVEQYCSQLTMVVRPFDKLF